MKQWTQMYKFWTQNVYEIVDTNVYKFWTQNAYEIVDTNIWILNLKPNKIVDTSV
jgi:hypothetical protein